MFIWCLSLENSSPSSQNSLIKFGWIELFLIDPLAPMGNKTKFLLTLLGLLVDPIPNSQNEQHKSYLADSKEKYK